MNRPLSQWNSDFATEADAPRSSFCEKHNKRREVHLLCSVIARGCARRAGLRHSGQLCRATRSSDDRLAGAWQRPGGCPLTMRAIQNDSMGCLTAPFSAPDTTLRIPASGVCSPAARDWQAWEGVCQCASVPAEPHSAGDVSVGPPAEADTWANAHPQPHTVGRCGAGGNWSLPHLSSPPCSRYCLKDCNLHGCFYGNPVHGHPDLQPLSLRLPVGNWSVEESGFCFGKTFHDKMDWLLSSCYLDLVTMG